MLGMTFMVCVPSILSTSISLRPFGGKLSIAVSDRSLWNHHTTAVWKWYNIKGSREVSNKHLILISLIRPQACYKVTNVQWWTASYTAIQFYLEYVGFSTGNWNPLYICCSYCFTNHSLFLMYFLVLLTRNVNYFIRETVVQM